MLVFLGAFSNPWFRSLAYELFVHTHILAALAYLGTMFWHAAQQKDSRHYLWATVGIWIVQLAARAWDKTAIFELRQKHRNGNAHVTVLDDDSGQAAMMRVTVRLPFQWTPGQHAFLRFPRLGILDNHPFTIASVPKTGTGDNEILFLIRPYRGLTKRLLSRATQRSRLDPEANPDPEHRGSSDDNIKVKANNDYDVRIDGPYGGFSEHFGLHKLYDQVVLVAGGGGISAMLPWLISLSTRIGNAKEPRRVQRVNLIWCIRHINAKAWVEQELRDCLDKARKCVRIDVYVTGEEVAEAQKLSSTLQAKSIQELPEKSPGFASGSSETSDGSTPGMPVHSGRPYMPSLLDGLVMLRKTAIMCCGPESLKNDVSNAAATLQRRVRENRAEEVYLHTETFGW